ncbi:MAG: endolytic transglycosylase MltG [Acidobacteriota bacterium]
MVFRGIPVRERVQSVRGLALCAGVAILAIAAFMLWFIVQVHQPFQGYPESSRIVLIERGWALPQIAETLHSQGIIRSSSIFQWYVRLVSEPSFLKAGEYRFEGLQTLPAILEKLRLVQVHHYRITIPEGLTLDEIATRLVDGGFGKEQEFTRAMKEIDLIDDWDPLADQNLEGYLFPDTYFFPRGADEQDIVRSMVNYFREVWTPEHSRRAQELELSIREVVTLASLIEKETGLDRERPLVSAVFHNRLHQNLKLACDPTVIYAVKLTKKFDGVINQSDLDLDSPYNTYLYPGLPPGPIANPGLASIEAALYPEDVDYLYFVSANDGSHIFSTHYRDHRRAVAKYQR